MSTSATVSVKSTATANAGATEFDLVTFLEQRVGRTEIVNSTWFTYNKDTGCWEDKDKDDYRQLAINSIHPSSRKVKNAHAALDHLQDKWRCRSAFFNAIQRDHDRLDSVLINVQNGVLRVTPRGVELLPWDDEYRFTRSLAVPFDPVATHDLFLSTLPRILPDPLDQHLYRLLCANALIPDARFETSAVFYGEAGSGKDTLFTPVVAIFDKAERGLVTNLSMVSICDSRDYSLPSLRFSCLNLCTELNSVHVEDSSLFKQIVSGTTLRAREIYKSPFDLRTHCKLIALSNNLPRFRDGTSAEIRRMRFVRCEFQPSPTELDVTLKERLKPAHSGMLNFLLEGLRILLERGSAPMPYGGPISREVHTRFENSNDPVGRFVLDHCVLDREACIPKDDLRRAFDAFSDEHSVAKAVTDTFFSRLYNRFPSITKFRGGGVGARFQAISGLRLTTSGIALRDSVEVAPE